jgi:hypothetical protein
VVIAVVAGISVVGHVGYYRVLSGMPALSPDVVVVGAIGCVAGRSWRYRARRIVGVSGKACHELKESHTEITK